MDSNGFGIARRVGELEITARHGFEWSQAWIRTCLLFIVVYCGAGERVHAAFIHGFEHAPKSHLTAKKEGR